MSSLFCNFFFFLPCVLAHGTLGVFKKFLTTYSLKVNHNVVSKKLKGYVFIYAFIQQTFMPIFIQEIVMENLLCARHYSKCWSSAVNKITLLYYMLHNRLLQSLGGFISVGGCKT